MIISYGAPKHRVLHLNRKFEKFKVEILKIEKDFVEEEGYDNYHYIYLCQKLEGADEVSKQYFNEILEELIQQQQLENEEEEQEETDNNENIVKNEVNLTDLKENINNVIIQNENDGKQYNLNTALKIELNNNNKKENQINVEKNKFISDTM